MKRKSILFFILFLTCQGYAQLTVSRTAPYNSVNYLVQNILLGRGVVASNITYSGDDTAIGFFNGMSSNIGLDSGLILTNCAVTDAPGPNNSPSTGYSWPRCRSYHDTDLARLIGDSVSQVHSAAVLEFDFIAYSDTITFQYVFGSEEYPEFVGSLFDDVFGFFVSGPGILGPYTHHAENIALIPFTATPVSINSVNCGLNSSYYVCNWPDTVCGVPCPADSVMAATTVQFDGFTVPLTAMAVVECGKKYHIKLAIANIGDCAYGSGVFLKSGSFVSSGVSVTSAINFSNNSNPSDTVLYRGNCDMASIYFERGVATTADTIYIDTSGTASPGIDYTPIPDTLILAQGVTGDTLNISAFTRAIVGLKTIVLTILQKSCGTIDTQKLTLYIGNPDTLKVSQAPLLVCYGSGATISPLVTGGTGAYTYNWNTGATTSSITVTNITTDSTFIVRVHDACVDTTKDTIRIRPVSVIPLKVSARDTAIYCPDTALTISVLASNGMPGYSYSWNVGGTTSAINISPFATKTYTVTVSDSCGEIAKDSITITVKAIPLILKTRDTTITCLGAATLNAITGGGGGGYTYLWNNGATTSSVIVSPVHDTSYVVTVHSPCGNQSKIDTVKVTVNKVPLNITTNATQPLCPGSVATISATATGAGAISYQWAGIGAGASHIVKPLTTTTYYVTVFDSCGNTSVKDSVTVTVLEPQPMGSDVYPSTITVCKEDIVDMYATVTGGNGNYTYRWSQLGLFTDTLYNADSAHAYLHANSSAIYQVLITDGCGDTTSKNVQVTIIPDCNLIIPNVFTPNGDGTNQYFYIHNLEMFPGSGLYIYNRWGNKIYESGDYQNNWDGTSADGTKLSDGVYYYILYLSNGKKYTGFIQLTR